MPITKVGFVGCGNMGGGMAANLLKAGFDLAVFDTNPEVLKPLVEQGATATGSPAGVTAGVEAVIMMLHHGVVEVVLNGENGVLPALRPGTILIDAGNSDPRRSRVRFQQCKDRGVHFLDAGVSGGRAGARDGTLSIMVGGEKEAFEQAKPLFAAMGKAVAYMGGPGAGHLSKLVNNLVAHATWTLVGEALAFAERQGLDMPTLVKAMAAGAARSFVMDNAVKLYQEPLPEDWMPKLRQIYEQRAGPYQESWALALADEIGHSLPIVALVNELTKLYRAAGDSPNAEMIDKLFYRITAMD